MAEALQGECMDVWNITIGRFLRALWRKFIYRHFVADMLMFDDKNYNVSSMPKNLKVSQLSLSFRLVTYILGFPVLHQMHW
jgi:hypothetical protein